MLDTCAWDGHSGDGVQNKGCGRPGGWRRNVFCFHEPGLRRCPNPPKTAWNAADGMKEAAGCDSGRQRAATAGSRCRQQVVWETGRKRKHAIVGRDQCNTTGLGLGSCRIDVGVNVISLPWVFLRLFGFFFFVSFCGPICHAFANHEYFPVVSRQASRQASRQEWKLGVLRGT